MLDSNAGSVASVEKSSWWISWTCSRVVENCPLGMWKGFRNDRIVPPLEAKKAHVAAACGSHPDLIPPGKGFARRGGHLLADDQTIE
jgi:hypothetical protein